LVRQQAGVEAVPRNVLVHAPAHGLELLEKFGVKHDGAFTSWRDFRRWRVTAPRRPLAPARDADRHGFSAALSVTIDAVLSLFETAPFHAINLAFAWNSAAARASKNPVGPIGHVEDSNSQSVLRQAATPRHSPGVGHLVLRCTACR